MHFTYQVKFLKFTGYWIFCTPIRATNVVINMWYLFYRSIIMKKFCLVITTVKKISQ